MTNDKLSTHAPVSTLTMSRKQAETAVSYLAPETFIILDGAVRTGKTRFGVSALVDWTLYLVDNGGRTGQELTFFMMAYNFRNINETLVPYVTTHLDLYNEYVEYEENGMTLTYAYKGQRVRIVYYGASNTRSYRSIQSATFRGGFIDEGALLDPNTVDVAIQRTITYDDAKIWISTNPEGSEDHPFFKQWLLKDNPHVKRINFTIWDNPIMSDEKIEQMILTLPDEIVQRKIYGRWVASSGRIYKRDPKTVSRDEIQKMEFKYIYVGNDYGEEDKTTSVAVGYDGHKYYVIDELVLVDTTEEIKDKALKQRNFLNRLANSYGCPITDYNETSHKAIYKIKMNDIKLSSLIDVQLVYKGKRDPHSKSVIGERIDLTNVMIAFDWLVFSDHLEYLPSALRTAVWKDGVRLDDGTSDIDTLDAFEYAVIEDYKYIMEEAGIYEDS